jgi:hypothetical protein
MKKLAAFLFMTLIATSALLAQQRTLLGINLTSNFDTYSIIKPEIGVVFERQFTNNSGFELGLNYRTYQNELFFIYDNQAYYPEIVDKYFSIPVIYKFYTKFLKLGAGLTFDYNLGREQRNVSATHFIFETDYDYYVGSIVKLSREFHLDDTFVIEPEVKANFIFIPFERHFIGVGINAKFDLHKDLRGK